MAHQFFISDIIGGMARLSDEDAVHARALRLRPDEDVIAVANGRAYAARVAEATKGSVTLAVGSEIPVAPEPRVKVTLYQALPKAAKLELVIQKCVELGITAVCPVALARCVPQEGAGGEKKLARWRRVAKEAAMQSGRLVVPEVTPPLAFESALESMREHELLLVPYEEAREPGLREILREAFLPKPSISDIALVIGPEGGMEKRETEAFEAIGGRLLSLGPRVLRTETAGMCVLAAVMYEAGELANRG